MKDENDVRMSFSTSSEIKAKIEELAATHRRSVSQMIAVIIDVGLPLVESQISHLDVLKEIQDAYRIRHSKKTNP